MLLLCASNAFMTCAWYLHLKARRELTCAGAARLPGAPDHSAALPALPQMREWPLIKAVLLSWTIAFWEYCLQASRAARLAGHGCLHTGDSPQAG